MVFGSTILTNGFFFHSFIQIVTEYLLQVRDLQGTWNIEADKRGSVCCHEIGILAEDMPSTNAKQVHDMPSEDACQGE